MGGRGARFGKSAKGKPYGTEYKTVLREEEKSFFPFAFAAVLSAEKVTEGIPVPQNVADVTPESFLDYLLAHGTPNEETETAQ